MRKKIVFMVMAVLVAISADAQATHDTDRLRQRISVWLDSVDCQPDWLLSRLQMYWSTHATDVFVNGEAFDHPGGERAPRPTVKFNGQRSSASGYQLPKLEDVVPYDDDSEGSVTYVNKLTGAKEKTHPSKTGVNIDAQNRRVLAIARDAACVYNATGDERYAAMAFGVFDTYVQGIYYRNVPIDMNHGHQQTLVGLTTFEVIHEEAVTHVSDIYSLLRGYAPLEQNRGLYDAALKKWADNIIAGGVPHNNWNLYQAGHIAHIALVLRSNATYADGRGREYYIDRIVNQSSIRQWSLKRLADYGFDPLTAIWCESPGYSCGVITDYAELANLLDRDAQTDIFAQLPVLGRSIFAAAQYLMPNRMLCGFGDTHPNYMNLKAIDAMTDYARRHQRQALVDSLSTLRQALLPTAPAEAIERYVSPSFYAPNVSWLIQRTGMNPRKDLCISLNASLGNHQHANGISMELYGRGFVLGPDAGIGKNLYSGEDYKEYYSQFPAHNTVCVNGVSSYPVMMSQHAFSVDDRYPADNGTFDNPCTYCQLSFTEPETGARQMRTNGIVKTSQGGYYVDIFRSMVEGDDQQFHDYFYHNLGQTMQLTAASGADLDLQPTDELAFAGGHLYAYSYLHDKLSTSTSDDIMARFVIDSPQQTTMTMWMQGQSERKIFRALAPVNREYERLGDYMLYKVDEQPVLTYVARQQGDAWEKPFVAIFEPSDADGPAEVEHVSFFRPESREASVVGICVRLRGGRTDYVFSSPVKTKMRYQGMTVNARYAVISNGVKLVER